jgi:hypothetical protein
MAVIPLAVATDGYLDSPLSVAVDGYLTLGEIPPVVTPPGGGGGKGGLQHPKYYTYTPEQVDMLKAQLLNEDDEILAIVMAAVDILQ